MRKVVKFGGSSLADSKQFEKVGNIISADESRLYVVPSAPGKRFSKDTKVTDMLIKAYEITVEGGDLGEQLKKIKARYDEIIDGLGLELTLDDEFATIKENLEKDPYLDYASSRGEYLNGKVLANYLGFEFIDPYETIFFNEEGQLNDYKTNKVLKKRLEEAEHAVIPGFYGQGKDGRVKTFSRGGSDVTGSIVAAAAGVDVYENWTDVSGFLVADPRIVEDPETISTITYRELRELSYMGASVLHEEAIFPVRSKGIPINIRNTNRPQDEGTWIFGRSVLQAFEESNISFEHMPSGIDTLSVVVHEDEFLLKEQEVVARLHRMTEPDSIEIESDLALIAVVGRGMKSQSGTAARLFAALANANVNIRMIDQGSSELNIIVGVANNDFEAAIRAIYENFVARV